jgi:hypothetical protein
VEEQIGHLRAQLLRSEQDKDLMRVKLEEETAEREKAQKQVNIRQLWLVPATRDLCHCIMLCTHVSRGTVYMCNRCGGLEPVRGRCIGVFLLQAEVAKKMIFAQSSKEDLPLKKSSRRETWCPGQTAWALPTGAEPAAGPWHALQELCLACAAVQTATALL